MTKALTDVSLQNEILIPDRVQRSGLVAGVVPGQRVGGQVEGAERVAAARHVLPDQVAGFENLKIQFQIRFLKYVNVSSEIRFLDSNVNTHD